MVDPFAIGKVIESQFFTVNIDDFVQRPAPGGDDCTVRTLNLSLGEGVNWTGKRALVPSLSPNIYFVPDLSQAVQELVVELYLTRQKLSSMV